MVGVVNPEPRTVTVYRSRSEVEVFMEEDVLERSDVVPGWRLPVRESFAA